MGAKIGSSLAFQRPTGKLYRAAAQPDLVDSTWTQVQINTIPVGGGFIDGIEDTGNYRITVNRTGYYLLMGQVSFLNCVVSKAYGVRILEGGLEKENAASYGHASIGTTALSVLVSNLRYLAAGTILTLEAVSYSGGNTVDINAGCLAVQRIR